MAGGGGGGGFAGFIALLVLIAIVPKPVWIGLGITAGAALVGWLVFSIAKGVEQYRAEAAERKRLQQIADAAAAKKARQDRARYERQHRIATLGAKNAELVESAIAKAALVAASEAAREGWLGDTDFGTDIAEITAQFEKAYALRQVAHDLNVLPNPSDDDRRLLEDARATYSNLEAAAGARVDLIAQCSTEAHRIDVSLQQERDAARTAEQRAQLHGRLSAMLYGIEAIPNTPRTDSAADRVMARVEAYREIKKQIQLARDGGAAD